MELKLCLMVIGASGHSCMCCSCASCFHHHPSASGNAVFRAPAHLCAVSRSSGVPCACALCMVIRAPVHWHVCLAWILLLPMPICKRQCTHQGSRACACAIASIRAPIRLKLMLCQDHWGPSTLAHVFGVCGAPSNTHLHVVMQASGLQRICCNSLLVPCGIAEVCWTRVRDGLTSSLQNTPQKPTHPA